MSIDKKLQELGLSLPSPPRPVANYVPSLCSGNLLFTSGILPMKDGRPAFTGKLGGGLSVEEGRKAAREAALNALAVVREELGDLDRVNRIIRLTGHIASAPGFIEQPAVLNGASDLLVSLFGDRGRHTRVALGAAELPLNSPVELELLIEIRTGGGFTGGS